MNFDELNLAPAIVAAVREHGYETPTAIQTQAIPLILDGQDLLGGAQTGTGKTAAFVLPLLHKLDAGQTAQNKFGGTGIRALILTPTRELAAQVEESVKTYGKHVKLSSAVVFGGVGMNPQINRVKKGVDILVATPGRLLDLMQQGVLDLGQVEILVLDEADRMLDMGFIHDVKKVLAAVPRDKQSLLFSATFSDEIRELAATLLRNPQSVQVTPRNTTVQRITQIIHPVGRGKKKALLAHIIQEQNWSQVLVFTRTKFGANNVAEYLIKNGITAMALHGNKSQAARTQALAGFKSGDVRALVATDIAARGIDIDDLPHVVNYEKAEPIAMGRQTIWGGAGKPPSRDVMQAAAKAARTEMMQRVRDNKGERGGNGGTRSAGAGRSSHTGQRSPSQRIPNPVGETAARNQPARTGQGRGGGGGGYSGAGNSPARSGQGQPDPMRTSVDMMAERGGRRGGGGFGGGNRNGGSYGGSGGRSNGSGGAGGGSNRSRGPGGSRGSIGR